MTLGALKKWNIWSLDIKNAFSPDFLRSLPEWDPKGARRFWKFRAPAYTPDVGPAALNETPRRYSSRSYNSLDRACLEVEVSLLGRRLYSVFRGSGSAVGDLTTRMDAVLCCGGPDILLKVRNYLERLSGCPEVQERSFVHLGTGSFQADDFLAQLTRGVFRRRPNPSRPRRLSGRHGNVPCR